MAEVPQELRSDSSEAYLSTRPISMIDAVRRQIDRIAYLRSVGSPWSEAVQQLRDMLVGLEDEQFWDGLPQDQRQHVADLEEKGLRREAHRIRAKYESQGWLGVPVRAVRGAGNRAIWRPTPENLSDQLRILMALLNRNGLLWKTRKTTRIVNPPTPERSS